MSGSSEVGERRPRKYLEAQGIDGWLPPVRTRTVFCAGKDRKILILGNENATTDVYACYPGAGGKQRQIQYILGIEKSNYEEVKLNSNALSPVFKRAINWNVKQWRTIIQSYFGSNGMADDYTISDALGKELVSAIKALHTVRPPRLALSGFTRSKSWKHEYAIGCVERFLGGTISSWEHMEALALSESEWKEYLEHNAEAPLYTPWEWINGLRLHEAFSLLGAQIAEPGPEHTAVQYLKAWDRLNANTLPLGFIEASDEAVFSKYFKPVYGSGPGNDQKAAHPGWNKPPRPENFKWDDFPVHTGLLPIVLSQRVREESVEAVALQEPVRRLASHAIEEEDMSKYMYLFSVCVDMSGEERKYMINMHSLLAILTHPGKETKDAEAVRLKIVKKSPRAKTANDSMSCMDFNKPFSYGNSSIVSYEDKGKGPALPRHRPLISGQEAPSVFKSTPFPSKSTPSLTSSSTPPLQPSLQPSLSALVSSKLSTTRLPKGGPEVGSIQSNSTVPPTNISVNQEASLNELISKQLDLFETLDPALKRLPEDPEEDPRPKSKKAKLSHDGGRMPLSGDYTQEELREVIKACRSKDFKIDEVLWRIDRRERERLEAEVEALESDLAAEKSYIHVLQQQVAEEGEKGEKEKGEKEKAVQQLDKVEGDLAAEKNRNQELQQQVKEEKEKVLLLLQRAEENLAAEKDRVKEAKKEVEMEKNILMEQLQAANENLATVKRKFGELIEGAVSWHETIHKKISIHTPMPQYCFIKNMFDEMAPSAIRSQCLKWRKMEEDKRPTKKHRGVRETSVPDIHIRIGDDGEVLEGEDEKTDVEG
jgi:hypothetical protein